MYQNNYVIIMAGGIGSRFWPFSRTRHPKQFQDILGTGKTLIQQTVLRFADVCPTENIYIVTNEIYKDIIHTQLPALQPHQILLEPFMRNTAPCIAYACYKIAKQNPKANIVVAPSDHIILREDIFVQNIKEVLSYTAEHQVLATLGIKPSRPDTGYGYIQAIEAEKLGNLEKVKTFTEKPSLEIAQAFLESGEFVWNAGIFVWNVQSILKAFKTHLSEMAQLFEEMIPDFYTDKEADALKKAYTQCRSISIDYGIMESATNVYVLRTEFGWSDLGTWKSVYEVAQKDENGNALQGNTVVYDTKNCIVKMPNDKLVVLQGLDNFIITEFNNVLLICQKDQEQRIKQFVADVKEQKGEQYL